MRPLRAHLVVWALALIWPASASAQNDLERARAFYNEGHFDESIAAATAAMMKPAAAQSATLIAARARLERFRLTRDPQDLTAARSDLVSLNPLRLGAQEAIEWQIGLGTALFLDEQPGPASEMFMNVISTARGRMPAPEFEKLLEWWAATLSRVAEALNGPARKEAYSAMQAAVREELDRNPLSRPATYWSVVARRGAGDLDGAWNAAVAGWIRAGAQQEAADFRADLDRFVTQTLIPERAQLRTGQRMDAKATATEIAALTEEWRALTERWKIPEGQRMLGESPTVSPGKPDPSKSMDPSRPSPKQ
jgi:hypothetical protein